MKCRYLVLVLAGLASSCARRAGKPRIDVANVQCRVGFADVVDGRRWNSLRLRFVNPGEDFRGTLVVRGLRNFAPGDRKGPIIYRMDLEIPGKGGAPREISFPVRTRDWTDVLVRLEQRGYAREFRIPLPRGRPEILSRLLVVAAKRRNFEHLSEYLDRKLWELEDKGTGRHFEIAMTSPRELPVFAAAFEPFDGILLDGTALRSAPPGACAALAGWVDSGGTLAALPGAEWGAGLGEEFAGLLGISPAAEDAALPGDFASWVGPAASSGIYRNFDAPSSARKLNGFLAVAMRRGAGLVVVSRFNPSGDPFPSWDEAPGLYAVLEPVFVDALLSRGNRHTWLTNIEAASPFLLGAMAGLRVPSVRAVVLGLGVYIVFGFLLPGILLWRRRREWTYAVLLVAAAAATLAVYRFGLLSRVRGVEIDEISLLRVHRSGLQAEATSFLGLVSPRRRSFRLVPRQPAERPPTLAAGAAVLPRPVAASFDDNPFAGRRGDAEREPEVTVKADLEHRLRLAPVDLYPNGMRYFRCDYRVRMEDFVTVRRAEADDPDGSWIGLENHLEQPVSVWYYGPEGYASLGAVAPGEERRVWSAARRLRCSEPRDWEPGRQWRLPSGREVLEEQILPLVLEALRSSADMALAMNRWGYGGAETAGKPRRPRIIALARVPVFPQCTDASERKSVAVMVIDVDP